MLQVTECSGLAPRWSREQGKAAQTEPLGVQGNKLKGKRMNSVINNSFKRLGLTWADRDDQRLHYDKLYPTW